MATKILLLGYTPDNEMIYSQRKRGWPSQDGRGFHPVCNKCDGYATVYGYKMETNDDDVSFPRPTFIDCPSCGGKGWANFILTLNVNNLPGLPYYWY
ncbi:MAG: hypothetical protein ABWX90_03270 [Candidatus Saccharimonadales bacterium]